MTTRAQSRASHQPQSSHFPESFIELSVDILMIKNHLSPCLTTTLSTVPAIEGGSEVLGLILCLRAPQLPWLVPMGFSWKAA